jgi:heme-degrading monooxygenase HmoA
MKGETMIARIWHGQTTPAKADDYMDYFHQTGLPDYQRTDGNLGVFVLRQDNGTQADFLIITFWESREAIREFAGDDIEKARYYPKDTQYFSDLEPNVAHYKVVLQSMQNSNQE